MQIDKHPRRVLSVFSLIMINVIAVDSLRTLPISAEYGFSLVFFYLLAAFIFFIPIALVAAELATGWPERGGLYVWVREAFGKRVGFFTIWLQWVYNIVWYPTILAFIAATLAYLFNPALANNTSYLLTSIISIFWLATLLNCFGMRVSSWVSTIGAIVGTILPMLIIILLGIYWLCSGHPAEIQFNTQSFFPNISNINNLAFFVGILFGLIGMEMSAVHAEEVKNPQRDYPRALIYSAFIIFISLVLSALAISMVVPKNELSLVSALIDAFAIFFKSYHMEWMIPVIVVMIIIGGISGVSAWIIGPTKGLMIAARDSRVHSLFEKTNRFGAPVPILILQAIVFTLLCSLFILMPTINSSYWILSAMTAQIALLVYVIMFAAAIRLRYRFPEIKRAYTIPGGNFVMWLIAGIGGITCLIAMLIGFFPPHEIEITNTFQYEIILIAGVVLLGLPPLLILRAKK